MALFLAELGVPQYLYDEMERIVAMPTSDVAKNGVEFDVEVGFQNGARMAVQVCGPGDPQEESCWTQGVLFSSDGEELGCTEPGDEFGGDYYVSHGYDLYIVSVFGSADLKDVTPRLLTGE